MFQKSQPLGIDETKKPARLKNLAGF